jgi:AmmeMemoRadiSam system protein B
MCGAALLPWACGEEQAQPEAQPEVYEDEVPAFDGPQPGADEPGARPWMNAEGFYEEDPRELYQTLDGLLDEARGEAPRPARAVLVPHAGLRYSGHIQASVFARVEVPEVVVILASDHNLEGAPLAIWGQGPWLVPGYAVGVRQDLSDRLREAIPDLVQDEAPFAGHPAEMQVVFLPHLNPEAQVVVVAIHDNSRNHFPDFTKERVEALGAALAGFLQELEDEGQPALLLTTTDLVHREPLEVTRAKDERLRELIAALDVEGLHDYVTQEQISICGEVPTALMMSALRHLGHREMEVISFGDSYDINNKPDSVTGYVGGITWR